MSSWIEGLYECQIDEPLKRIRSIYVNDNQRDRLLQTSNKAKKSKMLIEGKFKMFSDYNAILLEIINLELIITHDGIR